MRRTTLVTLLMLVLPLGLAAQQIRIPNTQVTLDLPTGEWSYVKTLNIDRQSDIYLYVYTDSVVLDSTGDTILPFLRVYVHRNYKRSAYELAYERFQNQPFQSMDEYSNGLPAEGIGYVGAYRSTLDEKDYQFRMIYFKERNNAIELRLETTADTYARFDRMFDTILRSTAIKK